MILKTTCCFFLLALAGILSVGAQVDAPPAPACGKKTFSKSAQASLLRSCISALRLQPAVSYCADIAVFLMPTKDDDCQSGLDALTYPKGNPAALAQSILIASETSTLLSAANLDNVRLDKEQGAPPSSDGSTNLVSKPGAPQLLAFAVQSGALTQTQSGDTATLQANFDRLARFLVGAQPPIMYSPSGTPILKNISVYGTLNMTAPSTGSIPTSGSATSGTVPAGNASVPSSAVKLNSLTVRYQFVNKYDPASSKFQSAYAAALGKTAIISTAKLATALTKHFHPPPSGCEPANFNENASLDDTINALKTCLQNTLGTSDERLSTVATEAAALNAALLNNATNYNDAIESAAGIPFTFEYVYTRPQSQPDTHDFRGIIAWNLAAGQMNGNFDVTIYGSQRPGNAKYDEFKDLQAAFEFDRSFIPSSANSPSWSVAGYAQWQDSPSVITLNSSSIPSGIALPPNGQSFIMGTRGWLGVVQAKLIVKMGSSQIPISAKWSNKTELLDKHSFGGQFGLTYDLSQLKQLFGSTSPD